MLPLAALAVTTAFLIVATGALAQERYRNPDEAVAALVDAVRSDAPQQMMRVLGPGSDEILRSGDPVDDAATRRRFLGYAGAVVGCAGAVVAYHQYPPSGRPRL